MFIAKTNWKKPLKHIKNRRTFAADCIKKERKWFFNNLSPPLCYWQNKLFWKTIKPFFSKKGNYGLQIKLFEKDEVLQDDDLIAKELNELFKNVLSTSNINESSFTTNRTSDDITDPIDKAIDKYKFHPSILLI